MKRKSLSKNDFLRNWYLFSSTGFASIPVGVVYNRVCLIFFGVFESSRPEHRQGA